MRQIVCAALACTLFAILGCSGPSKIMNSWIGKTRTELVKELGEPSRIIENGKDSIILMYAATVQVREAPSSSITVGTEGDSYTSNGAKAPPKPQDRPYLKVKMFYVNPSGIIYSWKMLDM